MAAKGDGGASVFDVAPRRIILERRIGAKSPSPVQILSIRSIEPSQDRFVKGIESDLSGVMIREQSVSASSPLFGSSFVERQYKFLIEIDPKCPVGSYYGNITLTTDAKMVSPNHRIDISLIIDGNIVATLRSVFAGVFDSEISELPTWNVRLSAAHGTIEIASIEPSVEWLTASVTDSHVSGDDNQASSCATVQICVTSIPPGTSVQSKVVVHTADHEEIRIPVVLSRQRQFSPISAE